MVMVVVLCILNVFDDVIVFVVYQYDYYVGLFLYGCGQLVQVEDEFVVVGQCEGFFVGLGDCCIDGCIDVYG